MQIVYGRHNVGGSNYHLQFTPKYRKLVFRVRSVRKLIEALMRRKAHQLGVCTKVKLIFSKFDAIFFKLNSVSCNSFIFILPPYKFNY